MAFVTVSSASLPSVPLDFEGNCERIKQSIRLAKESGAMIRSGPELEISGYGCLDHFLESETSLFSVEVLANILTDEVCKGMLIDVGLPMRHKNCTYNCRVLGTYRHIYLIRPKMNLAEDGLYRELRHFTAWAKQGQTEDYHLELVLQKSTGQTSVKIGDAILISSDGITVSCESCEELFVPFNPSTPLGLGGAEIILNASASHAELRKLNTRLSLIQNAVRKLGGCYVYSNAIGVDGEARMMFDGSNMIIVNGKVLGQSPQFTLKPVEILTATFDIEDVRSYRSSVSRNIQAAKQPEFLFIEMELTLSRPVAEIFLSDMLKLSQEIELQVLDPMEEIHQATAVWLWQYLVRTNAPGFFLSLSGGLDSASVALFVYGLARVVLESIKNSEEQTLTDLRRVTGEEAFTPTTAKEIVGKLLHTCYSGTKNSSEETRDRAAKLATELGAYHSDITIDEAIDAHEAIIAKALDFKPRYATDGGTNAENLAKQNIQARNRLVVQYQLAALSTTARRLPRAGSSLLVLGSGNLDENLRGYYTKYDASSADLAPLGSISKTDARAFQQWARDHWSLPLLDTIISASPSAELIPSSQGRLQNDEEEMGMTYSELSEFGLLRKKHRLGPYHTYIHLLSVEPWKSMKPTQVAEKVKKFYFYYAVNRHKTTILTPSIHLSQYDCDDNRFDLRPFLYVVQWPWQFGKIQEHAEDLERQMEAKKTKANPNQ